jgi:hypothetical protein
MPSKGPKDPPGDKRSAKTSKIKPPPSRASGEGGSGAVRSSDVAPETWTFEIVRPTPVAARVRAGESANGIRSGNTVAVSTDQGAIGFAPAEESARMLGALRRSKGATLTGRVDTAGDGKRSPRVTLALKRGG